MDSHDYVVLTDANFEQEVKQFKGVTVIDFWAEWCGPCRAIAPFIEKMAAEHKGDSKIKIAKLDTDNNPMTAMEYRIMSLPTVKFLVDGKVVDELNGFMGPATGVMLADKLQAALANLPADTNTSKSATVAV
jgi:thioredoxin 1